MTDRRPAADRSFDLPMAAEKPATVKTICPYCGVGCGLEVDVAGRRATRVRGDSTHPGTQGMLCRKAVYLPPAIGALDRLVQPHLRLDRAGAFQPASWHATMGLAADRLKRIVAEHGPDSVAFYISGQLLTEDYYVVNKLAKGFLGTNNVDSNSRLCMASAVAAYKLSFGQDGPPCAYEDLDQADCFLFIGSNAAECHPVLFKRALRRKQADPDRVTLIAVDPRRTATARQADLWLQVRPGGDLPLLYGLLHVLVRDGLIDQRFIAEHTLGWEALAAEAATWTPARAAEASGVPAPSIERAAQAFGGAKAALSLWSMGLNQSTSGVDKSLLLIALHLATGQIGKPGAGPFSLTGQPNAMGGREVGGLANLLPGHRVVERADHRAEMAQHWGVPVEQISSRPGLTAVEMFEVLADGRLKAIWIAATNPAVSLPDQALVRAGLERAELVVVQDAYFPTETTDFADIVLPAAQWSEKEGTATSSERRVAYLAAAGPPPGRARPDWQIFADLAGRLGFADGFAYRSADEIFDEYRACTIGTDMDIGGLSYERLRQEGPIQWPCPVDAAGGTTRLYVDSRFSTPDGKARFHAPPGRPTADQPAASAPFALTTGREPDQWHTMTRTGKIPQLLRSCSEPYLALHPDDAASLEVAEREWVEVAAPGRGRARFKARLTTDVAPGTLFVPFHWGDYWHNGGPVNALTPRTFDPISKQPELKFAAVSLRRIGKLAPASSPSRRIKPEAFPGNRAEAPPATADLAVTIELGPLIRPAPRQPSSTSASSNAGLIGEVPRRARGDGGAPRSPRSGAT
jgi:anaerobic selenocysteine-containing dehydrogenase